MPRPSRRSRWPWGVGSSPCTNAVALPHVRRLVAAGAALPAVVVASVIDVVSARGLVRGMDVVRSVRRRIEFGHAPLDFDVVGSAVSGPSPAAFFLR